MQWYTTENGSLCLGTQKSQLANFHVVTDVKPGKAINSPLLPEHAEIIGSYPEDWYSDEAIDSKINNAAKHFFGLSSTTTNSVFA